MDGSISSSNDINQHDPLVLIAILSLPLTPSDDADMSILIVASAPFFLLISLFINFQTIVTSISI